MKVSQEHRRIARHLFRLCLDNGRLVPEQLATLSDSLIELKPRGYQAIASAIARFVRLYINEHTAKVQSAHPLSQDQLLAISNSISSKGNDLVAIQTSTNPDLIAGSIIQFGDRVLDGSIRSRVNQLLSSR